MTTNETERLERDLEAAFAVPVPVLEFEPAATSTAPTPTSRSRAWKFGAVGALAAVAMLGAVLVLPDFGGSGPKTASAAELIERSIAATDALAANPSNYHMIAVSRTSESETITESWVGGPNRYRVEGRSRVDGETYLDGTVMSDEEMWIYQGPEDALVVAHGPRLISVLPARTVPLAQHLAGWNATGCFKADLDGTERVAGREAHVISVTPTPQTCPNARKPLKHATIWIDVETDIALKMVYEGDTAEHTSSFEVTLFESFESLPDSAFSYAPPAGAEVIEFASAAELKEALAPVYIVPRGSQVIIEHDWSDPVKKPANEGGR